MWRKRRRTLMVAALALAGAIALWMFPPGFYRNWQEPGVQEALVRHLLGHVSVETASLTLGDDPAPPDLLARLRNLPMKLSGTVDVEYDKHGMALDSTTKRPTIVCKLGPLHWRSFGQVDVEAIVVSGNLSGTQATYTVQWSPSGWEVAGQTDVVVSKGWGPRRNPPKPRQGPSLLRVVRFALSLEGCA